MKEFPPLEPSYKSFLYIFQKSEQIRIPTDSLQVTIQKSLLNSVIKHVHIQSSQLSYQHPFQQGAEPRQHNSLGWGKRHLYLCLAAAALALCCSSVLLLCCSWDGWAWQHHHVLLQQLLHVSGFRRQCCSHISLLTVSIWARCGKTTWNRNLTAPSTSPNIARTLMQQFIQKVCQEERPRYCSQIVMVRSLPAPQAAEAWAVLKEQCCSFSLLTIRGKQIVICWM